MRFLGQNVPPGLRDAASSVERCLKAFATVVPVRQVILFGSYARGEAGRDSDVDLCVVTEGAATQREALRRMRKAIAGIPGKPPLGLLPIGAERLEEKRRISDPFFMSVLAEGIVLAQED